MRTRNKIFAGILLVTTTITVGIGWGMQNSPQIETQAVFQKEQTGSSNSTMYYYWPTYFGAARIPVYSTFTAVVYEQ